MSREWIEERYKKKGREAKLGGVDRDSEVQYRSLAFRDFGMGNRYEGQVHVLEGQEVVLRMGDI